MVHAIMLIGIITKKRDNNTNFYFNFVKYNLLKNFYIMPFFQKSIIDLESIPKFDRNIDNYYFNKSVPCFNHNKDKNKPTITKISDKLWDRLSALLPKEKPNNTIGRPAIPFRKIMDDIVYVLRTGCQWKMLSSEYGSASTCHRRFQEWVQLNIFKKLWIRLLKEYDNKKGIKWT